MSSVRRSAVRSIVPDGCDEREYARLLGYPWGLPLEADVRVRALAAAEWYRDYGRPRVYVRELDAQAAQPFGAAPHDPNVAQPFRAAPHDPNAAQPFRAAPHDPNAAQPFRAAPHEISLKLALISAGPEVEREIDRLWATDRVDEAYFLDRYAAAVVERLARELGPYRSPGCGDLPFEAQRTLFAHLASLARDIQMLPSGMLTPRHSLLAVTPPGAVGGGNPCGRCDLEGCSFRRGAAPSLGTA